MSKSIQLDIEYPKRYLTAAMNGDGEVKPEQITLNVLQSAVNLVYSPQSGKQMGVRELRIWSRVQDKLMDDDGHPVTGLIELSDEQFDFIAEKVNEAKYPPVFAGPVTVICAYIDEVRRGKKEPSEPVPQAS